MTLNCKGQLINIEQPKVMGILNITPDSFYDGGKLKTDIDIINHSEHLLQNGATFIDIGGYSSRPNAKHVSETEELQRILPVIKLIIKVFPKALISVDTFRSNIAKAAVEAGAAIINDISAGHLDSKMMSTVGKLSVPYIMMHMKGTPQTMQQHTNYKNLITDSVSYFGERIALAHKAQIKDIIIDPGFGFSKTLEQNYQLLNQLSLLNNIEKPLLAGVSRKSMIYKTLKISPQEALNGTTALNMVALQHGAKILRVHDVKAAVECVTLFNKLKAS